VPTKRLRCWLLCEDIEQERLFRPILENLSRRRVRVEPRKQHGGASFVLQQIGHLAGYIRQHKQEAVALLVVIDGDRAGLKKRLDEIGEAAGFTEAAWEMKVARCVPCRNVETWVLWLCGERDVDEERDYKQVLRQRVEQGKISARRAAEAWFASSTSEERHAEKERLPALAHGRTEIDRLQRISKK
jgi:hypothetical protein